MPTARLRDWAQRVGRYVLLRDGLYGGIYGLLAGLLCPPQLARHLALHVLNVALVAASHQHVAAEVFMVALVVE